MAVVAIAAAVGAAAAGGLSLYLVGALVVVIALVAALQDWRRQIFALLVFLPFSGLPIIAAYPHTGPATLIKDVLFVIPAYVGYAATYSLRRRTEHPPGFPLGLAVAFAAIVIFQLSAPTLPNFVAGLIGAKVWLLYVPMAYLGYHLIRDKADLRWFLGLMSIAAVIPCAIGIVEGLLVNSGQGATVYHWYGSAASAVTQEFAVVGTGTATFNRVASTFSFVGQYFLFTVAMIGVAYAYWRGFLSYRRRTDPLGLLLLLIFVLAALLWGARFALAAVPLVLLLAMLLDGVRIRVAPYLVAGLLGALAVAAVAFGSTVSGLVDVVRLHTAQQFTINTVQGFQGAVSRTILGLGTGVDTVGARYALPANDPFALVGGHPYESWWVKAFVELGVAGLVLAVCLLAAALWGAFAAHRQLRDPQLRAVSAGLIPLLVFIFISNLKGSFPDLDPANVLLWLFLGVILKLPQLQAPAPAPAPALAERPRKARPIRSPAATVEQAEEAEAVLQAVAAESEPSPRAPAMVTTRRARTGGLAGGAARVLGGLRTRRGRP